MDLDKHSRQILREIQADGRLTIQDLSERVGLSSTPCWRRLKELEAAGVIRRYTALLDRRALGLNLCIFVNVSLSRQEEGVVEMFAARINTYPEVVECYETTGDSDYVLKVVVADIDAFNSFLHERLLTIPGVAQVRSGVALREVKYETALPL